MTLLRTLIFNLFIYIWTLLVGGLGMVTFITFNQRIIAKITCLWSAGIIWALEKICLIKVNIIGAEHLPKEGGFIVASRHESAFETIFFIKYFNGPAFVLKKELGKIPIYGWYPKKVGMVFIDRAGGASALKQMLRGARKILEASRVFVIFPEGTRVKYKSRAKPHPGIWALYSRNQDYDVIPVALNSGALWPPKSFVKKPGVITVKILPPISKNLKKAEFLDTIEEQISKNSIEL